ncbi:hypothetical protein N7495_001011 [Penicillium taxi]|uniref:uncharacterized protein n=1 Tax=Penicillium taxi TaxID=168475 RepID=UPI0025459B17|nr:uncharacterized protein N7495_001011 [Penicillium taxi]KAJ5908329.1 hypothetical protein N7495_001011 [Penicillium taxi]
MYVRNILLGGAATLSVSAMLVVPEMEPQMEVDTIEDGFVNVIPSTAGDKLYVGLACNDCPFREVDEESGDVSWTDGKPSNLLLDFEISENRLMANDRQIFPPVSPNPIYTVQELEDGQTSEFMPVGYALEVMPLHTPLEAEGAELLEVRFTILDLENHPVPVDTVAITLIQESTGDLHIAKANVEKTAPPEALSWKQCHGSPKCLQELIVSRVRGLLASAKNRFMGLAHKAGRKGCHGKPKGLEGMMDGPHDGPGFEGMPPPPPAFGDFDGPEGDHPPPPPHHHHHDGPEGDHEFHRGPHHHNNTEGDREPHHGPHHGHHHGGPISHTFSRVIRFIIVPAILGVLAGLTACAVGMLVGQAVVFIWQSYRGTKRGEHKAAWESDSCEKQGLMTEVSEETLPAYTDEPQTRGSMDKH